MLLHGAYVTSESQFIVVNFSKKLKTYPHKQNTQEAIPDKRMSAVYNYTKSGLV